MLELMWLSAVIHLVQYYLTHKILTMLTKYWNFSSFADILCCDSIDLYVSAARLLITLFEHSTLEGFWIHKRHPRKIAKPWNIFLKSSVSTKTFSSLVGTNPYMHITSVLPQLHFSQVSKGLSLPLWIQASDTFLKLGPACDYLSQDCMIPLCQSILLLIYNVIDNGLSKEIKKAPSM